MLSILDKIKPYENEDDRLDRALRPQSFEDYVGQEELKGRLAIAIEAAKERDEPTDHILLYGPAGLGKTTIANIIAKEAEANCKTVVATSIKSQSDIIELLTKLQHRDILFLDEIHALDRKVEETLYSAMEDYKINVKMGNKQIVSINTHPFCLIGATTMPGRLSPPLRDRFGIVYTMQPYTDSELEFIISANCNKLKLDVNDDESIINLAKRCRGVPRIANRLLRRVRDYAQIKNNNQVTEDVVEASMDLEGVDENGLNNIDHKFLYVMLNVYNGGPVGVQAVAATMGVDRTTIEDYIEPYLVRKEMIVRSKQGRMLTQKGMDYVFKLAGEGFTG